jgi:hypothetical protein
MGKKGKIEKSRGIKKDTTGKKDYYKTLVDRWEIYKNKNERYICVISPDKLKPKDCLLKRTKEKGGFDTVTILGETDRIERRYSKEVENFLPTLYFKHLDQVLKAVVKNKRSDGVVTKNDVNYAVAVSSIPEETIDIINKKGVRDTMRKMERLLVT